jgi:putative peptidoglycan lipid II flippase
MLLLRSTLNARIGRTGLPAAYVARLWAAAAAAAVFAWGVKLAMPVSHPIVAAIAVLGPYGLIYFVVTFALRIPEASSTIGRLASRFGP